MRHTDVYKHVKASQGRASPRGVTSKSLLALSGWTQLRVLKLGNDTSGWVADDVLVPEADIILCLEAWRHLVELVLHSFSIQSTGHVLERVPSTMERLIWQVPGMRDPKQKEDYADRRVVKASDIKSSVTAAQVVQFLSSHPRLLYFAPMLVAWLSQDPHVSSSRLVDVLTTRNRDLEVMHMSFWAMRVELDIKDAARLLRDMRKLQHATIRLYRLDTDLFGALDAKATTSLCSLAIEAHRMRNGDECIRKIVQYFPSVYDLTLKIDESAGSGLTYGGVAYFLKSRSYNKFDYPHACDRVRGDEADIAYLRERIDNGAQTFLVLL
jgi:hypothetical protein